MVSWGPLHTFFQHQKVLEKQLPSKSFLTVLLVWTKSLSVTKWSFCRGSQSFCCQAKMFGSHSNFCLFGAIFRRCTTVRFSLHGVSQGYLSQNGLCHDEHEHRKKETKKRRFVSNLLASMKSCRELSCLHTHVISRMCTACRMRADLSKNSRLFHKCCIVHRIKKYVFFWHSRVVQYIPTISSYMVHLLLYIE